MIIIRVFFSCLADVLNDEQHIVCLLNVYCVFIYMLTDAKQISYGTLSLLCKQLNVKQLGNS